MDLDRIKRNVAKMAAQNAPFEDIDGYLASEGVTPEQIRAHKPAQAVPAMRAPGALGAPGDQPAAPPQATPPQAAAPEPDLSFGDMAEDAAKSAGIGLVRGGLGLATLPGNIESLGRTAINAATGRETVNPDAFLPTADDAQRAIEAKTGKFYEPKSRLGKYARTFGEFAPMAAFPASLGMRAANVAAPALVSETAGQLTEGTAAEPWARLAGGLAGGMLPSAVLRVGSPAAPLARNRVRARHLATLEREGVTSITAGQRLGNQRIMGMEDATPNVPFAGQRVNTLADDSAEQFTRAALRHAGVTAERATPDVIDNAFQNLGAQFNVLANSPIGRRPRENDLSP